MSKKVFLVDDSTTMLMSMATILKKAGIATKTATDGSEALAHLQAGVKPDLVITDLNMPKMDGITLIREIRKIAGLRFMPILMLTTESQQEKRQEAKQAGATGWLVKPVPPNDLLAVITQVVPG